MSLSHGPRALEAFQVLPGDASVEDAIDSPVATESTRLFSRRKCAAAATTSPRPSFTSNAAHRPSGIAVTASASRPGLIVGRHRGSGQDEMPAAPAIVAARRL